MKVYKIDIQLIHQAIENLEHWDWWKKTGKPMGENESPIMELRRFVLDLEQEWARQNKNNK